MTTKVKQIKSYSAAFTETVIKKNRYIWTYTHFFLNKFKVPESDHTIQNMYIHFRLYIVRTYF